jgi:hypothetical protein
MGQGIFLVLLLVGSLGLASEDLPAASGDAALPHAGFEFAIIGDLPSRAQQHNSVNFARMSVGALGACSLSASIFLAAIITFRLRSAAT